MGIIPSRFGSTRFPGKPLVDIGGKSMIQRVYEQAKQATSLADVIVATDDDRILNHVKEFGGKVIMTSSEHQSGTDRCAEIAESLPDVDVIINIQGDEPFVEPEQINQLAACFENPETEIATLCKVLSKPELLNRNSIVKVKPGKNGIAEDFGRVPFPNQETHYKHIGVYAYRVETLKTISKLPQSERELTEKLEQLRWLDNGFSIQLAETEYETISVDTPEDLAAILKQKNL